MFIQQQNKTVYSLKILIQKLLFNVICKAVNSGGVKKWTT